MLIKPSKNIINEKLIPKIVLGGICNLKKILCIIPTRINKKKPKETNLYCLSPFLYLLNEANNAIKQRIKSIKLIKGFWSNIIIFVSI